MKLFESKVDRNLTIVGVVLSIGSFASFIPNLISSKSDVGFVVGIGLAVLVFTYLASAAVKIVKCLIGSSDSGK